MGQVEEIPNIIAVVCRTHEPAIHITDVNISIDDVKPYEDYLVAGKLIFPFSWYDAIDLCNKDTLKETIKQFSL